MIIRRDMTELELEIYGRMPKGERENYCNHRGRMEEREKLHTPDEHKQEVLRLEKDVLADRLKRKDVALKKIADDIHLDDPDCFMPGCEPCNCAQNIANEALKI